MKTKIDCAEIIGMTIATAVLFAIAYVWAAWVVFQWRNPLANEMSLLRNFSDVIAWEQVEEYQVGKRPTLYH